MRIMLAYNDSQGNPTDTLSGVEIIVDGEIALKLEPYSLFEGGEKFKLETYLLEIHGCVIKHSLLQTWVGNVAWNIHDTIDYYALGLIRALQLSKKWVACEGWEIPFEKFIHGDEITGKDFELDEDVQGRVVHPNQLEIRF